MRPARDNGLKKALKMSEKPVLSSNFTFKTMMKLEEEILLERKKREQQMFLLTIAFFSILTIGSIVWLTFYTNFHLSFPSVNKLSLNREDILFISILIILLTFDYIMRILYQKKHS